MPTINYEYVDLGLPSGTLWAKYNIGATSETEYGNYYQYGKGADTYQVTSGQSDYSGTENPLAASADTAAQVWGGKWRMPTQAQLEELTANTTYEWTTINDVHGAKFTAANGNYVFIPCAGYYDDNGSLTNFDEETNILASTPDNANTFKSLSCGDGYYDITSGGRDYGFSVRAVKSYGKVLTVNKYYGTDNSTIVSTNSCDVNFELSGSDTSWITNVSIDSRTRRRLYVYRSENNYIERTAIIKPKINNVVCEDESKWIKVVQESGCECGTALSIPTPSITLESGSTSSGYVYYNTGVCFASIDSFEFNPSYFNSWISVSADTQYGRLLVKNRSNNTGLEKSGTVIVNYSEAEGCTASTSFTVVRKSGCGCGEIKTPTVSAGTTESSVTWTSSSTTEKVFGLGGYDPNPSSGMCYSSVTTSFTSNDISHWQYFVNYVEDTSAPYRYEFRVKPHIANTTTDDITGTFIIEYTLRDGIPGATCQLIINCTHEGSSCISTFTWL